jgi:predicted transcriptional regulator
MSDDERKRLDAALDRSIAQAEAGQGIPVEQVIAEIRAKRAARARVAR